MSGGHWSVDVGQQREARAGPGTRGRDDIDKVSVREENVGGHITRDNNGDDFVNVILLETI